MIDPEVMRRLDQQASLIRQLQGHSGQRVRGVASVSTTAAVSGSTTVTHGLGTTPFIVLATANNDTSISNVGVASIGATTFDVGVRFTDGVSRTTTIQVGWEAIA